MVDLSKLKILYRNFMKVLQVILIYAKTILRNFVSHDIFFYASSLSFQVVLCFIPTILLVIWILGSILSPEALLRQLEIISAFVLPKQLRYTDNVKTLLLDGQGF